MHRVRMAVHENRLVSTLITEEHYISAIEVTGRGWVAEDQGFVIGFAIGNAVTGNIWALFVHPDHEGGDVFGRCRRAAARCTNLTTRGVLDYGRNVSFDATPHDGPRRRCRRSGSDRRPLPQQSAMLWFMDEAYPTTPRNDAQPAFERTRRRFLSRKDRVRRSPDCWREST
jgi:hypothetical protein